MSCIHHSAICVRDVDASMRFWCDGLGFEEIMDQSFEGDWPTLLRAPTSSLRAVFLGDRTNPEAGIVELVDFGAVPDGPTSIDEPAVNGFLLLSVMTDLHGTLDRLADLGLGGVPRRVTVMGVDMAVVVDPNGVHVELVDTGAVANLEAMRAASSDLR